ncbi:MAG: hypothetical protein KDK53_17465 [Maritimibacter sp.]|nr:hypothetical protein [Maritimibacter sp.]
MPYDLFLIIGLVIVVLSIPAIFSAVSDGHAPRVPAVVILIGGGLVTFAATQKPGGYELTQIPNVFIDVVSQIIR